MDFYRNRINHQHIAFDKDRQVRTLSTGLTLIHTPVKFNECFYIGATIGTGARLEKPSEFGISHFLEHMMFRGSKKFPAFAALAEAFENLGGEWNAATGFEHTEYWYNGICHTALEVVKLFGEFLIHPLLTDIEIERNIILRELDGETNDLGHSTDLEEHISSLIWPRSSLDRPIIGTRDSLGRITLEQLRRYRDTYYTPERTIISVIGGHESLLDELQKTFSNFGVSSTPLSKSPQKFSVKETYPALPEFIGNAVKWVEHNDNEYSIKLSFVCGGEWSSESHGVFFIARILGDGFSSRLARRLREELGLVYDISCHANLGLEAGTLDIDATCSQDQLDEFLQELFALLKEFRDQGPTSSEVERARFRTLVDLDLSINHPEALGSRLAWSSLCQQPWSLAQERLETTQLTLESIDQLVKMLLVPQRAALVALGPKDHHIEDRMKRALTHGLTG